ncbi:hypothetical protein EVAR_54719_1 [Eumeta japonica]|uniref:Uncharacterized protein n=1 Tax=Eumeta variegata TaxID=151549 RepID=A0A4C1YSE0_EUMVA|nr:hypothetical protein EVAR_54719_1 [Eumeta japonica]
MQEVVPRSHLHVHPGHEAEQRIRTLKAALDSGAKWLHGVTQQARISCDTATYFGLLGSIFSKARFKVSFGLTSALSHVRQALPRRVRPLQALSEPALLAGDADGGLLSEEETQEVREEEEIVSEPTARAQAHSLTNAH